MRNWGAIGLARISVSRLHPPDSKRRARRVGFGFAQH